MIMLSCYHDNVVMLSCYHDNIVMLSCYHVIMITYHVIMITYHVIMITLSCYHVIMLSCYHYNMLSYFFPENFTHWIHFCENFRENAKTQIFVTTLINTHPISVMIRVRTKRLFDLSWKLKLFWRVSRFLRNFVSFLQKFRYIVKTFCKMFSQ
jgi:hypothetical protein